MMNKNLLIRIGIAVAILFLVGALALPALVAWICLVWIVWKRKTNIFHDQMEPKLAERQLKRLKVFLLVAGISLAVGIVGFIVQLNLWTPEREEPVSHYIALVGIYGFSVATIGGLVIILIGRRKPT